MTVVGVWMTCSLAYLVLAGQVSLDEGVAAIVTGAGGTLLWVLLRRVSDRRFWFDRWSALALARALTGLPAGIFRLGRILLASLHGDVSGRRLEQPFHGGERDDPEEAGRRAIVVLATSLAPNSFVLRVERGRDLIAVHGLADQDPRNDPRWPI
ncbi:MAG TPA: hypothetical protein VH414_03080 [Lichenihabitans sp.]|jgi:hypothetical protein|nr:hypothetical protein [Lichenihabitans sp.]